MRTDRAVLLVLLGALGGAGGELLPAESIALGADSNP
jgi:hypothetical protein